MTKQRFMQWMQDQGYLPGNCKVHDWTPKHERSCTGCKAGTSTRVDNLAYVDKQPQCRLITSIPWIGNLIIRPDWFQVGVVVSRRWHLEQVRLAALGEQRVSNHGVVINRKAVRHASTEVPTR